MNNLYIHRKYTQMEGVRKGHNVLLNYKMSFWLPIKIYLH
jgi:hypothetical protein